MRRVVDLTSGAAKKIGITSKGGVGRVKVEVLGKTKPAE
jgi:rare lipoprotein A (peptidoglycan hydrolase)